jgi:ABC-2 type transport system ATP-binding protein
MGENMKNIVIAENLQKAYKETQAVNNLSLTLKEGTITGLIGPNGAGKTTTIKMLLGLLKPDSGRIEVFGQTPWDNPDVRRQVGVVHEKAFFPAHQKTLDYLQRTCRIFGVPESRALEVMKLVDLQNAQDRKIRALSAGMLQKFSISHALIHHPQFIIGDEMTVNLDPQARTILFDLILQLHKDEKVTFLISSHILPELSRICDSIAIINKGKVLASGELNALYEKYSAGTIRIITDKPENLAAELKQVAYLEKVEVDFRSVSLKHSLSEEEVYADITKAAKKANAKINGIETGNASVEELYNQIVNHTGAN